MNFSDWWRSNENPCRSMPESTQVQIVDFMHEAFKAGEAKSVTKLRSRGYTVTKGDTVMGSDGRDHSAGSL